MSATTGPAVDPDDLPLLDFFDAQVAADPSAAARRQAAESWIARTPTGLAILRWDECKEMARDRRFRTPPGLGLAGKIVRWQENYDSVRLVRDFGGTVESPFTEAPVED